MESMELDFDDLGDDDPIEEFLRRKLEEIRSANDSLGEELKARSELLGSSVELKSQTEIMRVWKRVFNSKFVLGIHLESPSLRSYEFVRLVLSWDYPGPLTYCVKIYDLGEWGAARSIGTAATVLAVLEKPPFYKQTSFTLTGFLEYRTEHATNQTPLPHLCIDVGDFVDSPSQTQISADQEFLVRLVASDVAEFVGKTQGKRQPESLLEIDCMFRKLDVKSRKKYFLINGVSPSIDGCLLELQDCANDGVFYFNVLSRSQEQLTLLLHYLHRSVEGLSVLPKSCEVHLRKFIRNDRGEEAEKVNPCVNFRRALLQEVGHLEDFRAAGETGNYPKFRKELSELEYRTDVLRVECDD